MKADTASNAGSAWSATASGYSDNIARASQTGANSLVKLTESMLPIGSESSVLDVGSGTGVIACTVAQKHPQCHVLATDIAPGMLEVIDGHGLPNVSTQVLDALKLRDLGSARFTHVFITFMLQAVTEPAKVVSDVYDCLKPGGVFGLAVWGKRMGPILIWERSRQTIDPSYRLDHGFDDPNAWTTTEELQQQFEQAGFVDMVVEYMVIPFPFASADAWIDFFFGGKNPHLNRLLNDWTGDRSQIKEAMRTVCIEEFGNGQGMTTEAALCVGRKALHGRARS